MILLSIVCLIIGILLEVISVDLLVNDWIYTPLITHLMANLFIVLSCKLFLTLFYKKINHWIYLFIFLMGYFVPIFGLIINAFIFIAIFRFRKKFHKYAEIMDDDINLNEMQPMHTKYGSGGAFIALMKKNNAPSERTKALFVLGQNQLSNINKLMYKLLSDDSNEIRLLAFNILDQQESVIVKDIHKLLAILDQTDMGEENHAKFEKNLAMLYWELSYCHLLLQELEESSLSKAQSYALSALEVLKDDATLWALLGKIYGRLHQYKQAEEAFDRTTAFNIPPSQVMPYLAEIQFKKRNYIELQNYLSSETLLDIPLVAPVKHFWDKK